MGFLLAIAVILLAEAEAAKADAGQDSASEDSANYVELEDSANGTNEVEDRDPGKESAKGNSDKLCLEGPLIGILCR